MYTGVNKQRRLQMKLSQALEIVKTAINNSELSDYDKKSIVFDLVWLEGKLETNNEGDK